MTHSLCFKRTLLASAISLAFAGNVAMADDEVRELIDPSVSEVGVTLWHLNEVNPLYRTYTGLNNEGAHGTLDLNFVRRTEGGRWFKIEGRGLGQNNQELQASAEQQGDWGVRLGYNEITRYAPLTVVSGASGIGSDSVTLAGPPPASGSEHDLKTKRSGTSIALNKFLSENLRVNFSFKHEDKEGARLSGINGTGYMPGLTIPLPLNLNGIPLQVFAPEPINSTHQQFEASVDYTTRDFQVSAGYYGSFFRNNEGKQLNVYDSLGTQLFYSQALAPDNQSQEFHVSGAYRFNEGTRGTFSASKAFGKQDDSFIPAALIRSTSTLNPAAAGQPAVLTRRSNLDGEVETTNIAATLSSRVTRNLTLNGSLSYDEHDDKTPQEVYVIDWGHNNDPLANNPETIKTTRGKLEGVYRLPADYRLTVGYDYDKKRYEGMDDEGFREEVQEDTFRIDLSKSLNDYLNGSLTLSHGEREGSSWGSTPTLKQDAAGHPTGLHWTAPTQFSDRERDKVRLLLDWTPLRALSLQFAYEYAQDEFETRHLKMGLNDRKSELYSLDATYRLGEKWKASAWYSYGDGTQRQRAIQSSFMAPCDGTTYASMIGTAVGNTCVPWSLDLESRSESAGLGFQGQLSSRVDLGGRLQYSRDVAEYDIEVVDQGPTTQALSGAGILPDTEYTLTTLHLFAKYAVTKATSIRLDYIWDRREMDDYTWSNWSYSDGTTVLVNPNQITRLMGVTVSHAF